MLGWAPPRAGGLATDVASPPGRPGASISLALAPVGWAAAAAGRARRGRRGRAGWRMSSASAGWSCRSRTAPHRARDARAWRALHGGGLSPPVPCRQVSRGGSGKKQEAAGRREIDAGAATEAELKESAESPKGRTIFHENRLWQIAHRVGFVTFHSPPAANLVRSAVDRAGLRRVSGRPGLTRSGETTLNRARARAARAGRAWRRAASRVRHNELRVSCCVRMSSRLLLTRTIPGPSCYRGIFPRWQQQRCFVLSIDLDTQLLNFGY